MLKLAVQKQEDQARLDRLHADRLANLDQTDASRTELFELLRLQDTMSKKGGKGQNLKRAMEQAAKVRPNCMPAVYEN